jgi:histone deacetylase HOS3
MDHEIPIPSIERDDLPTVSTAAPARMSIDTAASTPLSRSSLITPRKPTPKPYRYASSTSNSPTNHDRQATPPVLQSKRSASILSGARGATPLRKTTSNPNPPSPSASMKPKPILTAASVAQEYFRKELDIQTELDSETVVLVHDSCYGHRFSRPRTSKAALNTIVERPERIHATILGASTAYVRLGDKHCEGKYGPHPDRNPDSISPPFKIRKTSRSIPLNHPSVTHVHGSKWMEELQIMCDSAEGKLALNGKELVRPIGYGKDENGAALSKLHEGDLYLCSESLNALQGCLGGVCDAADTVFGSGRTKRAFVCIRPPGHHCSSNFPSGFCWLNNVHVGIAYSAMTHGLTHAAIIDFDLHHGDGSQSIAWNHNQRAQSVQKNSAAYKKTPIGYFSLHDINSYPCEMGDEEKVRNASLCIENAHGQSIWNVHLEPWKSHDDFWRLYKSRYSILLEKTRLFLRHHTRLINGTSNSPKAKAAIFLSAGFDASEWEGEGMQRHKVNVPTDFYAKFTADVVKLAEEEDLGVDGRVISVLEGGYSDRALMSGVLSHVCGLTTQTIKITREERGNLLDSAMDTDRLVSTASYDSDWWSAEHLEVLESRVNPHGLSKKSAQKTPGNYTSPTQASTAKMTDQARERKSLSAQFDARLTLEPEPELPPPEVDWAMAAYELSQLIIPKDRQTLSCSYEELNAEAMRARRERQSTTGLPTGNEERMQLRDRKSKQLPFEAPPVRPSSRNDKRRTTIAAVADLPDPKFSSNSGTATPNGHPRRRSSAGSSIISAFQDMQLNDAEIRRNDCKDDRNSRAPSELPQKATRPPTLKKARVTTVTKPIAKTRASPKTTAGTAPLPNVPSTFLLSSHSGGSSVDEVSTSKMSSQARGGTAVRSGSAGSIVKSENVDTQSTGMKKMSIKLHIRSSEDRAAKEAGAAEGKLKKPRAPRKPVVPKALKTTSTTMNMVPSATDTPAVATPIEVHQNTNSLENPAGEPDNYTSEAVAAQPTMTTTTNSNSTSEPISRPTDPLHVSDLMEAATTEDEASTFAPQSVPEAGPDPSYIDIADAIPDTKVSPSTEPNAEATLSTVPNISFQASAVGGAEPKVSTGVTPKNAIKTKADLPTFTSSSPIPFAKPRVSTTLKENVDPKPLLGLGIHNGEVSEPKDDGAGTKSSATTTLGKEPIWDILETP